MCKTEIFAKILEAVSRVTEVDKEDILSDIRREEVVDARSILAFLMNENGFYIGEIAACMKRTRPSIRYLLKCFENRSGMRKMIRINMEEAQKYLLRE